MHPLWQLTELFLSTVFITLIAVAALGIEDRPICSCLLAYKDDNFAFDVVSPLVHYLDYSTPVTLSLAQAQLLQLWDEAGVPHAAQKQLFGHSLTFTGFYVDSSEMTIALPDEILHAACCHYLFVARSCPILTTASS